MERYIKPYWWYAFLRDYNNHVKERADRQPPRQTVNPHNQPTPGGCSSIIARPRHNKQGGNKMKFKTTQKAIKQGHANVIKTSYCALQSLLSREQETAYTTRAEGWGADIYTFGNTAIVTGYAPFGNIRPSYETNQKYESKARKIIEQYSSYEIQKRQLSLLITEYIEEVTQ